MTMGPLVGAPWTAEEKAELTQAPDVQSKAYEIMQRRRERANSLSGTPSIHEPTGHRPMRSFETGATRDSDDGKLDFEGYLSPNVLTEFARYMHKHGQTAEGQRASDNWQNGFGEDVVMKSLLRHVMDLWMLHRGYSQERPETGEAVDWSDALGGAMFNIMALWHERLQKGEDA